MQTNQKQGARKMNIDSVIARYEDELVNSVIPFWEKNCEDREFGGYFTLLDRDGSVYDTGKYMWMQWRIVYMFATFYNSIYRKDNYLEIAKRGYDFLTQHGRLEDGSYYFQLNRKGEPAMANYSIFSDCFAAMGAAALYEATGEDKYRVEAESAMNSYIRRIPNPKGRYEKCLPGKGSRLSLGSYMILANLGAVMKQSLKSDKFESDTSQAVDTVMRMFWNPEYKVLCENVNTDGSFDYDSCEGRFVNPGHGLETMWFIMQYAERTQNQAILKTAFDYVDGIFNFGWDKEFGGIYYFMDLLGKPHLELQWDMKLWWPHNEASIAMLYAYRLSSDKKFLNYFKTVDEWTWSHFPDREYGEWFGYLNRRGEPTHLLKGGKWKTFFHVPRSLLFCLNQLKAIKAAGMEF